MGVLSLQRAGAVALILSADVWPVLDSHFLSQEVELDGSLDTMVPAYWLSPFINASSRSHLGLEMSSENLMFHSRRMSWLT